jgi:hypothetical protein
MLVNDCEFLRWFLKIRFEQTMVSIAGRNIKKTRSEIFYLDFLVCAEANRWTFASPDTLALVAMKS